MGINRLSQWCDVYSNDKHLWKVSVLFYPIFACTYNRCLDISSRPSQVISHYNQMSGIKVAKSATVFQHGDNSWCLLSNSVKMEDTARNSFSPHWIPLLIICYTRVQEERRLLLTPIVWANETRVTRTKKLRNWQRKDQQCNKPCSQVTLFPLMDISE